MNANKMKSAQLKMIDSVLDIFKTKNAVLDQRLAVKKDVTELKNCREDIAKQLKAVKPVKQHASNKDVCREKLRGYCMEYAAYLARLGRDMEGDYLVNTFGNPSSMMKSDILTISFAQEIIEHMTDNLDDLADVGITQDTIDAFEETLNNFIPTKYRKKQSYMNESKDEKIQFSSKFY